MISLSLFFVLVCVCVFFFFFFFFFVFFFVLFFSPLSIVITSLGELKAVLVDSYAFVYFARVHFCPFTLPLGVRGWCRGLAAVCDCGTHWIFLLTFVILHVYKKLKNNCDICKRIDSQDAKLV